MTFKTPPPQFNRPKLITVVLKLKNSYNTWQKYLVQFPKSHRFTIGSKIDCVFLDCIELSFLASYSTNSDKVKIVSQAITKLDLLKLLIQLAWETKCLSHNKYGEISLPLDEIGKMLGGWKRQLLNKTPAGKSAGETLF